MDELYHNVSRHGFDCAVAAWRWRASLRLCPLHIKSRTGVGLFQIPKKLSFLLEPGLFEVSSPFIAEFRILSQLINE